MVENNKIKALEEHGRKVDEHIQHLQEITEEHGKKLDQINSQLEAIMTMLKANWGSQETERVNTITGGIIQRVNPRGDGLMNQRGDCFGNQEAARVGHHMAMTRIDLSNIHVENPRSWIHKYNNGLS